MIICIGVIEFDKELDPLHETFGGDGATHNIMKQSRRADVEKDTKKKYLPIFSKRSSKIANFCSTKLQKEFT